MKIIIDLPETTLLDAQELASLESRSRKKFLELTIIEVVKKAKVKTKEK
jgi:hypothetical protein